MDESGTRVIIRNKQGEVSGILGIFIVDGEGVALVSSDGYGSVAKISFPLGVDDSVPKSDDNQQISLASLPSGEDAYDSYIEPTSGDIYVLGTLGNAFRYDASTDTFENIAIEGHAEQNSLIVASEDGRASIGQVAEEGITISFAPLFALRQVWFWIGLAIVLALFVTRDGDPHPEVAIARPLLFHFTLTMRTHAVRPTNLSLRPVSRWRPYAHWLPVACLPSSAMLPCTFSPQCFPCWRWGWRWPRRLITKQLRAPRSREKPRGRPCSDSPQTPNSSSSWFV